MTTNSTQPNPARSGSPPRQTQRSTPLAPHDITAEQGLLGSVILFGEEALERSRSVEPKDFYRLTHGDIWRACLSLSGRSEAIDLVTMQAELTRQGTLEKIGGYVYLIELADFTPSVEGTEHYAKIVKDKALLRGLIHASQEIATRAYAQEEEASALAESAESLIARACNGDSKASSSSPVQSILPRVWSEMDEAALRGDDLRGSSCGLRSVDAILLGLVPGYLYIMAGRPAMGKTSCALDIAVSVSLGRRGTEYFRESARPALVFSTEMTREDVVRRMLCSLACVDNSVAQLGKMSKEQADRLHWASQMLYDAPLEIDDETTLTTPMLFSRVRRHRRAVGELGLIVVDYAQRLRPDPSKRYNGVREEMIDIAKDLKRLARETNTPVLAVAQLSRGVERREDKRPIMSDLAESGQLEAEADVVALLYRAAYYARPTEEPPAFVGERQSPSEEAEIIIAKHRNGPVGSAKVQFSPAYTRFDDLPQDTSIF